MYKNISELPTLKMIMSEGKIYRNLELGALQQLASNGIL